MDDTAAPSASSWSSTVGRPTAHPAAFERDRRRGQVLSAAGYTVFRVTRRQLIEEPVAVAVRLAQTLAGA